MEKQELSPIQQKVQSFRLAIADDYVQSQLRSALGESSSSFAASLIDLFSGDDELQKCDPKRVIMQAMKAAILKLPINKNIGYGYIIAFGGKPEFIIGYKGLVQLAIRTGMYEILNAGPVYEGEYRTANKLTGEFDLSGEKKSDKIIGYFAHFEMKNGFKKTLYMTAEKVEAHGKKYSKSYNSKYSPWQTEPESMGTKTALRGLLTHWGYMSAEMSSALETDDVAETVREEISNNGNRQVMSFDSVPEAEIVRNEPAGAPF